MSATVAEYVTYYAICNECGWHGEEWEAEDDAADDATEHDELEHGVNPEPADSGEAPMPE